MDAQRILLGDDEPDLRRMLHRYPAAEGFEVADTGRGLSVNQLAAVFERFYRADRTIPGGTGNGLTIARGLARAHGGDVTAHSPGLWGAIFTLSLPVTAPEPSP